MLILSDLHKDVNTFRLESDVNTFRLDKVCKYFKI